MRYLQVEAEYNHVSAEQIRAAATAHLGTGFFALKLEDVRAAVAKLPWVERVEARKRWPETLVLHVRERQPFARWGEQRLIGGRRLDIVSRRILGNRVNGCIARISQGEPMRRHVRAAEIEPLSDHRQMVSASRGRV